MFFPKKIKSIKKSSKVLEIGPGNTPHPRSDVLLEKKFQNEEEYDAQIGYKNKLITDKKIIYYDGNKFPFADKEFDYVICSHVLEHIDNAEEFVSELCRVAKGGYLEFPTVYYEYLYNFEVHKIFLLYKDNVLYWMKKEESGLENFVEVNKFFNKTLVSGQDQLLIPFKEVFFQGFEWNNKIEIKKVDKIKDVCFDFENSIFRSSKYFFIKNFLFFYKIINRFFVNI